MNCKHIVSSSLCCSLIPLLNQYFKVQPAYIFYVKGNARTQPSSHVQQERRRNEDTIPALYHPLTSQALEYSLGIDSFPVVHEVARHLKRKAHRVVLPHSFYHTSLIILQGEHPRVTDPITPRPVAMHHCSSHSTVGWLILLADQDTWASKYKNREFLKV